MSALGKGWTESSKSKAKSHSGRSRIKGSKSASKSSVPSEELSEWIWDPLWRRWGRSREVASGEWEYEYCNLEDNRTPRTSIATVDGLAEDPELSSVTLSRNAQPHSSSGNVPSDSGFQAAATGLLYPSVPTPTFYTFPTGASGASAIQSNAALQPLPFGCENTNLTFSTPVHPQDTYFDYSPSFSFLNHVPMNPFPQNARPYETFSIADGGSAIGMQRASLPVDPEYTLVTNPDGYFKLGRIFSAISPEREKVLNEPLIFVVMREGHGYSVCCILQTSTNGSFRSGHGSQNRALVFAAGSSPQLLPGEEPPGMGEFPIIVEKPTLTIDPALRLDFDRVCTIEHNVKVRNIGRIDRNCLKSLKSTFLKAMGAEILEDGNRPTGFGDNNDVEGKAETLTERVYEQITVDRIGTPIVESVGQYDSASDTARRHRASNSSSSSTALHSAFKVHQAKDFEFGKIFKILWSEPKGQGMTKQHQLIAPPSTTLFGEGVYTSIRRFVIVKPLEGHCICLPILTYKGQGTSKGGVKPQDHAIIFTEAKGGKPEEMDGREKLLKKAIKMSPLTARDQLDPLSRLNYAKIYTVEYNVKVCFIGRIHKDSVKYFIRDFNLKHQPLPENENLEFSDISDSDMLP